MHRQRPAGFRDRFRERDVLGADGDAVLGVAALLDAADGHERVEPFAGVVLARRVRVEEDRLADRVRAEETLVVSGGLAGGKLLCGFFGLGFDFDLGELRARIDAAATTHAFAQRISDRLLGGGLPRAGSGVVVAIDRDPGFDPLQVVKQPRAIDHQVAHDGKLGHRAEFNLGWFIGEQLIDECRTGLPDLAVDDHRARAADFFETVAIPRDGRDAPAIGCLGIRRDLLQDANHVHVRFVGNLVSFPIASLARSILAQDTDLKILGLRSSAFGRCVGHESVVYRRKKFVVSVSSRWR